VSRIHSYCWVLLLCVAAQVGADDPPPPPPQDGPLVDAPDPFADPPDPFADPPDPFADPPDPFDTAPVDSATQAPVTTFDPQAVDPLPPPAGFEIHGRANGTLAITREDESVELLEDSAWDLSSVDLYLSWFPTRWFGMLGEAELQSDVGEGERRIEFEVELLALELRPLSDKRVILRLGRQPVPFGLERRYYAPPRNELANRPAVFRRVFPGTYSDTGAFLWLRQPVGTWGSELELELGITKGLTGPDRDDRPKAFRKDNNDAPEYSGRAAWTLFDLDPGRKGASPGEAALPTTIKLTVGASILLGVYDRDVRRRIRFYGVDGELWVGGLRVRGEAVWSDVESLVPNARARRGFGTYVLAAYHLYPELFLLDEVFFAFRYGRADRDQRTQEPLDVERYHAGLGWIPHEGFLFKAGLEWSKGRGDPGRVIYLELGFSF